MLERWVSQWQTLQLFKLLVNCLYIFIFFKKCKAVNVGERIVWKWTKIWTATILKVMKDHVPESTCEQNTVTACWARVVPKTVIKIDLMNEWNGRTGYLKIWMRMEWVIGGVGVGVVVVEGCRLTPQSCVIAVKARTERSTSYKQLGARVIVAVGVHSVGKGMNVWEVTPPSLIMILKTTQQKREILGSGEKKVISFMPVYVIYTSIHLYWGVRSVQVEKEKEKVTISTYTYMWSHFYVMVICLYVYLHVFRLCCIEVLTCFFYSYWFYSYPNVLNWCNIVLPIMLWQATQITVMQADSDLSSNGEKEKVKWWNWNCIPASLSQ